MNYLEEDLEIVDALDGQFQVFAQSFIIADFMTVFLSNSMDQNTID